MEPVLQGKPPDSRCGTSRVRELKRQLRETGVGDTATGRPPLPLNSAVSHCYVAGFRLWVVFEPDAGKNAMNFRSGDARTIRLLRKHLTGAKAVDALFARFDAHLKERGYPAMGGRTVDAAIIEAPRRRTTEAGKGALKAGRIPEAWSARPAGLRRKDCDGRWTL